MSALMHRTHRIGAQDASPRQRLARLASIQHGVVGWWQLLIIGYTRRMIAADTANGRLHRLHRGVYAVGHTRLTRKARWMAAVLACGPDAVLSHRAAAALHDLRPAPSGPIDVTVPHHRAGKKGVRVHNVRALHPDDVTMIDGIPVTSLDRTLLDYAGVAGEQWARLAVEAAQRQERLDATPLRAVLARSRGRRGGRTLRKVLGSLADEAPWTQSEPERRLLAGLRGRGVTEPSVNVVVEGELVDFHWQRERLIVEADGDFWHKTPAAREKDRRRDVKLQTQGQTVARFGEARIEDELELVVDEIEALLRRRRSDLLSVRGEDPDLVNARGGGGASGR